MRTQARIPKMPDNTPFLVKCLQIIVIVTMTGAGPAMMGTAVIIALVKY